MSLDVRPEFDVESFTRLEHLKAISLNHGLIQDCGRGWHITEIFADESFTKRSVRWQGKKRFRIECHFWYGILMIWSDGRWTTMANKLKSCRFL